MGIRDTLYTAARWFVLHHRHVAKLLEEEGPAVAPSGSDIGRPELWKAIHWRWFLIEIESRK